MYLVLGFGNFMVRPSFCLVLTSVLIIQRVPSSTAFLMQINKDRIILCLKSCTFVFACISNILTFLGSIIFRQERKAFGQSPDHFHICLYVT